MTQTKKPRPPAKKSLVAQTKRPTTQTKRPTVQTKRSTVQTKRPTVQTKKPTTKTKRPTAQTKKPRPLAKKSLVAQTTRPTTQTKRPTTQTKKLTTQTKRPTAQIKKPTTQTKKPTTQTKKLTAQTKKPRPPAKTPLFHKVLHVLKQEGIENQKLLVAVSGGADSSALLHLLKQCAHTQNLKLYATYVHHGPSSIPKIKKYRDKAQTFVSGFANKEDIPFLKTSPSPKLLKNEAEARAYRYNEFKKLMIKKKIPTLVLAHNENDVLETQLIHLIRGCAEQGLKSLTTYKAPDLRPLLQVSRAAILEYLKIQKISFLDDPSNKEDYFLRNWIRLTWLPLLDKKRPGSLATLSRSLSQIALKEPEALYSQLITPQGLKRDLFLELSPSHKRRALAQYMRQEECKDYGLTHINEILKQLDRSQKTFNLRVLKKTWKMSSQFISIETKK